MRISTGSSLRRVTKQLMKRNNAMWQEIGDEGLVRHGDDTYYVDQEGNETYLDSHPEAHDLFKDGDTMKLADPIEEEDPQSEIDLEPIHGKYTESLLRRLVRRIIKEETSKDPVPEDAPPSKQVHLFDFDDTLGVTEDASAVMLYQDGKPIHKSEEEVEKWLKKLGISKSEILEPGIIPIPGRDGAYAAYASSAALAKIQSIYPRSQQKVAGKSEPQEGDGEDILIDFSPSSSVDADNVKPIKSTINKMRKMQDAGATTGVITARAQSGTSSDIHGNPREVTNEKDLLDFLEKQGIRPSGGITGVSGANKANAIMQKFMNVEDPPEEIHFYDDMERNTSDVEALGEKIPSELFIYGPGEFDKGEASAEKPTKKFPKAEKMKEGAEFRRWMRLAGLDK